MINLLEIRYFISRLSLEEGSYTISNEEWAKAKRDLKDRFARSINLEIVNKVIKDFEAINRETKYISDLEIFIRESKLEDFFDANMETIIVSTIHKAKGREFENVILLLDRFNLQTDEAKRLLYVAMTRAKKKLVIHYIGDYFNNIKIEALQTAIDTNDYPLPSFLAMQLAHRDVWLDFFKANQKMISQLESGDKLEFDGYYCRHNNLQPVLKVSKHMNEQIEAIRKNGYVPRYAIIRYIIYWRKEDSEDEIKIILPELHFGSGPVS